MKERYGFPDWALTEFPHHERHLEEDGEHPRPEWWELPPVEKREQQ